MRAVRDEPDQPAHALGVARAVVSRDRRGAARRTRDGGEDLQQRGLAGAVGTEQPDRLAGANAEVHAVEHESGAIRFSKAGDLNQGIRGRQAGQF